MGLGGAPSLTVSRRSLGAVLGPFHFPVWCDGNMYSDLGSLANRFYGHLCWRSVQPRSFYFSFRWSDKTFAHVSGQGSHGHLRPLVSVPSSQTPLRPSQPPTPTFPGLARLRPRLPARFFFDSFLSLVLLPVAHLARPALFHSAAVLLLWPPLLMLISPLVLPPLVTVLGSSALSPLVPTTLSLLTGGPRSVPCALTSMPTLLGSSLSDNES